MKAAADASDADALNSYIDYPALREDLKAEITARMLADARKGKWGFARLGAAIETALAIDGLVSPAGMRTALIAKRDGAPSNTVTGAASALHIPENSMIVRRGFSEFLVATKQQPNNGLVFRRHGLAWKLSGVELPPST